MLHCTNLMKPQLLVLTEHGSFVQCVCPASCRQFHNRKLVQQNLLAVKNTYVRGNSSQIQTIKKKTLKVV